MTAAEHMRQVLAATGVYALTGETPVDWELEAYGAGFALVAGAVEDLLREVFLQTAPAGRLAQWEAGWPGGTCAASLEARREMAAQWMASRPGPLQAGQLSGLLLAAGIRGEAAESGGGLAIAAEEYWIPEAQARARLQKLLPVHMGWSLTGGGTEGKTA